MFRFSFVLLICGLLFTVGCAPKITASMIVPAKSTGTSELRNVAVMPFQGNYGSRITPAVESAIASAEVEGIRYFTVADRQNLDKIMSEQKLQLSGVVDTDTVVELGRLVGVSGIYTGTADLYTSDSFYPERRVRCVSADKNGRCLAVRDYMINCVRRRAELVFIPKLTDVSTSEVIYTDRFAYSLEVSRCDDSQYPLISNNELVKSAENRILKDFRYAIAPYEVRVSLTLMTDDEGINEKAGREKLKSGIDFAKAGRLDRACEIWAEGRVQYVNSKAFAFNTGLCHESRDETDKALELYNIADRLSPKPDKLINTALERVKRRIAEQERLRQQL